MSQFALRIALASQTGTRAVRMFVRKDLPPSGYPATTDPFERRPDGDAHSQRVASNNAIAAPR